MAATLRPIDFRPALTDARLRVISERLLDVLYDVELELSSPLDDAFTRGTTTFGRQRNALIEMCQSGPHTEWLKLTHAAMDLTFEIGGVPCRFFVDDPSNPRKPGFYRRNDCDQLFAMALGEPVIFRFVVEKPKTPDDEAEVHFIGFDEGWNEVFAWQFSRSTPVMASVDDALPAEVPLAPAEPRVRRPAADHDQGAAENTNRT